MQSTVPKGDGAAGLVETSAQYQQMPTVACVVNSGGRRTSRFQDSKHNTYIIFKCQSANYIRLLETFLSRFSLVYNEFRKVVSVSLISSANFGKPGSRHPGCRSAGRPATCKTDTLAGKGNGAAPVMVGLRQIVVRPQGSGRCIPSATAFDATRLDFPYDLLPEQLAGIRI